MVRKPQVACVIVNYNNANYLERCVSSVIEQSVRVDEIILADDASTDDSNRIIHELSARYDNITPIFRKKNLGVSQNRHQAILSSKAQFITTLDSDDFFYPTKIESELNALLKTRSDIAFSDVVLVDTQGVKIKRLSLKSFFEVSTDERINILVQRNKPIPRDMLFKREVYNEIGGFSEKLKVYEDFDLKLRLLIMTHAKWTYSHALGTAYRIVPSGLSKSRPFNNMVHLYRILMKHSSSIIAKVGLQQFMISLFYLTVFHVRKAFSCFIK